MEEKGKGVKQRRGINLIEKILFVALLPLVVIVIIAALSIRSVGQNVSEKQVQHELKTAIFAMEKTISARGGDGNYHYDDGQFFKGSFNISGTQEFLDEFKQHTEVDVTLFWDKTRVATSIHDKKGNRILGTEISNSIYQKITKNGYYFSDSIKISDEEYFGYYELLNDGENKGIIFVGLQADAVKSIYARRLRNSLIFMLLVLVASCVLIARVMYMLSSQIMSIIRNLDRVAQGELDSRMNNKLVKRNDEIGKIFRALYSLITGVATIVNNIHKSGNALVSFTSKFHENFETINHSIANINIAVDEIAQGATTQANETQKVNSQIGKMGNAITETTKNVEDLMDSTEKMKNQNGRLDTTLNELMDISRRTKDSIDAVYQQTGDTNHSVMEIGSVVDIIADIASQTNLLSLNASIEAARAGEHGRGFAVVADEIRQLADQSSESAGKIGKIVEELIRNSNVSVTTMNSVLDEINKQNSKLNATREVFGQLDQEVKNVAVAVRNISTEVDSINKGKNDVLSSSESLAAIAQENAASTQETSASMIELSQVVNDCTEATQELVGIAENMEENVNKFHINEDM